MKEIYWYIVVAVLIFGIVLPQRGNNRKIYIVLMASIHAFISAFRYRFLTGDLLKYNTEFQDVRFFGYFSERVFREGKNTGFYWLMKFLCEISDGYFPILLIVTAIVIEIAVAILIFRYASKPWLAYLIWDCFAFYIFGFSAVKQSLAMAFVMIAAIYIFEDKPFKFLFWALLAATIHMPALAFLPAYWIAKKRIRSVGTLAMYIIVALIIYIFRNPIVTFITSFYYEDDDLIFTGDGTLGGRFMMMVLILFVGFMIKGFKDRKFEKVFNLMIVAAILQMFSGFDNVFTRFADYFFQFSIIYIPLLFTSEETEPEFESPNSWAYIRFNRRSLQILTVLMAVGLIWYYNSTTLARPIEYGTHDYLEYYFDWNPVADEWRIEK